MLRSIGGRRAGAGRKKAAIPKIKIPAYIEPDLLIWLRQFGERNRSKVINEALRWFKEKPMNN